MLRKHKSFSFFYLLLVALNVYVLLMPQQILRMVVLPMVGISLLFYLLIKTQLQATFHKLIFAGLVFSLAGDVQLLFSTGTEFYLLSALIATLFAYSFYAIAYYLDFKRNLRETKQVGNILLVCLLLVTYSFYNAASKNLESFRYPGMAYLLILSIMVVLSAYRHRRVNKASFKLILTGSFSFLISDLSIGYYHFVDSDLTMLISFTVTYLVAQYLVVMGTIEADYR